MVSSTRVTCPRSSFSSRTRSPTVTASSTSAVRTCGGLIGTSTPQASVNSHSFLGWLTRATTWGTPYSCFDRSEITRLSSSSPVAATMTSQVRTSALSRTHGSQASPRMKLTPGASSWARSSTPGSCSTTITWCPRSCRSNARCRPMLPAPATTILMESFRRRLQEEIELVGGVLVHHEVSHVPLLERGVVLRDEPGPAPLHPDHLDLSVGRNGGDLLPEQVVGKLDLEMEQEPAGQRVAHRLLPVEQEVLHLLGGPPHAGHGGDVELLVDVGPAGIVDPGDHLRYLEVLAGHPGRDDVRVVAVRHGDERVGLPDPRLLQDLPVEPEADDRGGLEPRGEAVESLLPLVDDGDGVPGLGQLDGQLGSDPTAPHDHEMHGGQRSAAGRQAQP